MIIGFIVYNHIGAVCAFSFAETSGDINIDFIFQAAFLEKFFSYFYVAGSAAGKTGTSDTDNNFTWESREDIINLFTRSLFEIAIEPVPSRFESDDSSYSDKIERAYETVSELQDTVTSFMTTEFIKRYRDSDDAWESDGYSHLFPEEVEEEENEKKADVADEEKEKNVDVTEDVPEKKEEKVERKENTDE